MTIFKLPVSSQVRPRGQAEQSLDELLDRQLRQLLHDLQLLVPYDVAAAWLGHDARPSLRVAVPVPAAVPSLAATRHLIFQTTGEAARIADLFVDEGANPQGMRSWMGLPLVLHGRRRGWIELMSSQPNLFSDADLQRIEVVVRNAAAALTQLEAGLHSGNELRTQRELLRSLEHALLAPDLQQTLQQLVADVASGSRAHEAALLLPLDLAFALDLDLASAEHVAADFVERDSLVAIAAHWAASKQASDVARPAGRDWRAAITGSNSGSTLLPLISQNETVGWLWLSYATAQPLAVVDPASLRQVSGVLVALLVWLREQKQREQHAQQAVRMLMHNAHQQRAGELASVVAALAQELKQPVGALLDGAGRLQGNSEWSGAARADVAALMTAAGRLNTFVQRLASVGETAGGIKQPLALNEIVSNTLVLVGSLARQHGVEIQCELPPESPMVVGNRAQLQRACLDLLTNALDAVETCDAPVVRVAVDEEQGWAVLRVSDNGYGIPEEASSRIWMPGFTTKAADDTRRNLGIGLTMALEIVQQHQGTLRMTSQVWQGSCFTVRLPINLDSVAR